jgi:integrase
VTGWRKTPLRERMRGKEAAVLQARFSARSVADQWPGTTWDREMVLTRLNASPFALGERQNMNRRRKGLVRFLDWLEQAPGGTWQERWRSCGIASDGRCDWRPEVAEWLIRTGRDSRDTAGLEDSVTSGLGQLIYADVIRPSLHWLLSSPIRYPFGREMPRVRDATGFAALQKHAIATGTGFDTRRRAVEQISVILAAKGGTIADITVSDCLEFMNCRDTLAGTLSGGKGAGFYQLLHTAGIFPADAPATLRMLDPRFQGQLETTELIDQYLPSCRPIRDLLVEYLNEHQPRLDYGSLKNLAYQLGKLFWKDLENHHRGIDSLHLPPDIAAAWKLRLTTKTITVRDDMGEVTETTVARIDSISCLTAVRAFYLDIAQWALDDPARWAQWAVPCPIRREDIRATKVVAHRKSRMDQRTRERLTVLATLLTTVQQARTRAAAVLGAAAATTPGESFTTDTATLRRSQLSITSARIWAEDPHTGARQDLTRDDEKAFWTWAAVEVLRCTGLRIEELTELSHHSLTQYRLPDSGELIPLLHIAPSKTDVERLLVVSPDLADVLAAIIHRVRDRTGAVPLVIAYDVHECEFTAPMPVLFQRHIGIDNRPISAATIRRWITDALTDTGLTDASGHPLAFQPHDFRRIFATDAIMNGMPPHICQLIMGHKNINTTMGYKTVYPEEVITSHRAFIARRRELRPSTEYRSPTTEEWDEFLGHFQHRKVSLGTCGRAYGTSCLHEHACTRCALLRPDPAQRPRLTEIRDNLIARITEAQHQGWLGEVNGLKISLTAANNKIAQLDIAASQHAGTTNLGIPTYRNIASETITLADTSNPTP